MFFSTFLGGYTREKFKKSLKNIFHTFGLVGGWGWGSDPSVEFSTLFFLMGSLIPLKILTINIVRQYDRDKGTRKVVMPKNPEEVAKPSIGKVICTRGKDACQSLSLLRIGVFVTKLV